MIPALAALAQQTPADKGSATSTVSGHVYWDDTNAPARMATVLLIPVTMPEAHGKEPVSVSVPVVRTIMDGSFSEPHVPPGTYYVVASAPGSISPLAGLGISPEDLPKANQTLKDQIDAAVPRVNVQENVPVSVDVQLERGAAVGGRVLYDDGSPASDLSVVLLGETKDGWDWIPKGGFSRALPVWTDDRGVYRFSGLTARKYVVKVDLRIDKETIEIKSQGGGGSTGTNSGMSLPIYSGSTWRQRDAESFSLKRGEDREGEDIRIPVSKLHSIRGTITAAHDGHVVNGAMVHLTRAGDDSIWANISLTKDDDGFNFSFVPEGDYTLSVPEAADIEYEELANPPGSMPPTGTEPHIVHRYGYAKQKVHVDGNLTGITIAVPELRARQTAASQ